MSECLAVHAKSYKVSNRQIVVSTTIHTLDQAEASYTTLTATDSVMKYQNEQLDIILTIASQAIDR